MDAAQSVRFMLWVAFAFFLIAVAGLLVGLRRGSIQREAAIRDGLMILALGAMTVGSLVEEQVVALVLALILALGSVWLRVRMVRKARRAQPSLPN